MKKWGPPRGMAMMPCDFQNNTESNRGVKGKKKRRGREESQNGKESNFTWIGRKVEKLLGEPQRGSGKSEALNRRERKQE